MKNIDETITTVFDRMENYKAAQKRKQKVAATIAIPICACCIFAFLGFGISNSMQPPTPDTGKQMISGTVPADKITVPDPTLPKDETPVSEPTEPSVNNGNKIVITFVDREIKEEMGIALFRDDFISMTKDELTAYYGCTVFPDVPDDISPREEQHWGLYRRNQGTGEIYYEQNRQAYENADKSRGLIVETRKGRHPFFDFVIYPDVEEYSTIRGIDVVIGQYSDGSYCVWFLHNNVGYYLNAVGLTQDELIGIIESLIV